MPASGTGDASGGIHTTVTAGGSLSAADGTVGGSGGGGTTLAGGTAGGGSGSQSGTTSADSATSAGSGGGSSGNDPGNPLDCGGSVYACGDGLDNDDDGLSDLEDPECTGPCDDDESSFQTGLPGDNMDCRQDCFFDGNSGQGDDKCLWDLRCDAMNPGANVGCEYTGGNNCNNNPPNQDPQCVTFCSQFVPPGCDCFGCCTVQTADGPVDIFLNSGPDCSLDNLDGCQPCTSQIEICGVPCVETECQICFGQSEPPPECGGTVECTSDIACTAQSDCPSDYYCQMGCCYPPPPG